MATEATLSTGIFAARDFRRAPPAHAPVELFGHVRLVETHGLANFDGAHAVIELRDHPGVTVAVLTKQYRLQSLLESAVTSGNLVGFMGTLLPIPPAPRSGDWAMDVYSIEGVTLYSAR
jgi:hypothetical protein